MKKTMRQSFPAGIFDFQISALPSPALSEKRGVPMQGGPLGELLADAALTRWAGMRSERRNVSQGNIAIRDLHALGAVEPQDVTKPMLRAAVRQWAESGISPATCRVRLNSLSALGIDVKSCRPRVPNSPKWWLRPEDEDAICAALEATGRCTQRTHLQRAEALTLAHLIRWTTRTGLRIEESLRLEWAHVTRRADIPGRVSLTVPGTKSGNAQASIPLSEAAIEVLDRITAAAANGSGPRGKMMFAATYLQVRRAWAAHRYVFNLDDPKRATLKAMRRSAARSLHVTKGMPLDLLRQYLRHGNVATTLGYLRLTGGYAEDELARWL